MFWIAGKAGVRTEHQKTKSYDDVDDVDDEIVFCFV